MATNGLPIMKGFLSEKKKGNRMNGNGLVVGASAKVKRLTGRYAKYLTRPNREGIITAINPNSVRIKFLHSRRDRSYYCHEHSFHWDDLEVTKHHKNSKRGRELEALRLKEIPGQQRLLAIFERHDPETAQIARDIRRMQDKARKKKRQVRQDG